MIGWLLFISLASFLLLGGLGKFSGQLAARLRIYTLATSAISLLLAAGLIWQVDPWVPAYLDSRGINVGSGAWVVALIDLVLMIGPQWTAAILAAFAIYLLHTLYYMRRVYRLGVYHLPARKAAEEGMKLRDRLP